MHTFLRATSLVAVLSLAAPGAVLAQAQSDHDAHHPATSASSDVASRHVDGTVKKVDKAAVKLTIAHGPIESLAMPAMTMVFRAADPAMLERVKAGDRIRFTVDKVGGALTVTSLEVTP
ncbi:MAG: copper-binding protein [Betaproteobacteria bacterium]|nr:MAG: copper-binding protein [Betaproteobacteria bacterium]